MKKLCKSMRRGASKRGESRGNKVGGRGRKGPVLLQPSNSPKGTAPEANVFSIKKRRMGALRHKLPQIESYVRNGPAIHGCLYGVLGS